MYKINFMKRDVLRKSIQKTLFIMRLTIIIILIAVIQLSAKDTRGQTLTYNKKGITFFDLVMEIRKQTSYGVVWSEGLLNGHELIDADFYNTPVEKVLDKLLFGRSVTYKIVGKAIVIKVDNRSLIEKGIGVLVGIDIRGRVLDENNVPLVGATVKVKGSTNSTVTNANGEFSLQNVNAKDILVISFIGYNSKEIKASENLKSISLISSTDKLQEVEINAGYYTVTDRERTGNISRVDAKAISQNPVSNPLMALQGRVTGLQVTQQSGIPGGGFNIQIRGQNSLKSGNNPLYIIDGVVFPSQNLSTGQSTLYGLPGASNLASINPGDIESIEVLKDADATAIYGSRGANGVILITTKRGKAGKTTVGASFNAGFSEVGHFVNTLNTEEYLSMRREAFKNDALQPGALDHDLNGIWKQDNEINWQKELIGGKAKNTSTSVNVNGGDNKNNYILAANYYTEGTVFPGDFGLKRASVRSGINLGAPNDKLTVNLYATYTNTKRDLLNQDLTLYILLAPNAPQPYNQEGKLNWDNSTVVTNPMALLLQKNNSTTDNLLANLSFNYKIFPNFKFKASLSYNTIRTEGTRKFPLASISPIYNYTAVNRSTSFSNNYNKNLSFEPQFNYNNSFGLIKIDALLGLTLQNTQYKLTTVNASNFSSDELMDNIGSAGLITNAELLPGFKYRYLGLFSRLNFNIKEKYFINFTARRDGSSRFGPDKKFANFGAIGAAWILSEEQFLRHTLPFVSFAKIRASYGITGNDQIGDYRYLSLWNSSSSYQGAPTLSVASIANNDFAWETNQKLEAGIQLGIFKDKLNINISFYRNRSSNQLLFKDLPISIGPAFIYANLPATVQNTGWEFDSSYKIIGSKNFNWTTSFNLTIPKNKLISYPGLSTSNDFDTYVIGEPLAIGKFYNASVSNQSGLYVIEDKDNSGTINPPDRQEIRFLGQKYYGGFQNSIRFKQFSLDMLLSFVDQKGNSYQTTTLSNPGRFTGEKISNQLTAVLERWQKEGDATSVQKFSTLTSVNTLNSRAKQSTLSVVDASYIRLRNIALSFNLPNHLLEKVKISNCAIYLQAQNLVTITKYIGLDPETATLGMLPPLRTFAIGINLSL
ncbi:SusC/RagA family TonB-linked outer membrane protein [Pedobacter hiemivivus]|uniref:SusC/RagA family TonB-linked outer membrane protein n=1 Tax=Pedobacter hiemivivus TaxID=2530454 RepID=A0A4R0NGB4_9SPHI|nr:SusC/RagA family TonB-linked outer membrane protein [Pedobacter hiemivivus]TCC99570.1 SusC/RagA family TonB-linked outer membrane protein [Pedobacter hiemivivus]